MENPSDIRWTGYLRLENFTFNLAQKAVATGICSIDTTFTGSQKVIDSLKLGYSLEQQLNVFNFFKKSGFTDRQVKLYMPINAPGETAETLRETIQTLEYLYALFGREHVLPFIFFIGVQPGTPIERYLKDTGYLNEDYNPLTLNPFTIKKLLYNPPPLGPTIARAYLNSFDKCPNDYVGRLTMDALKTMLS